MLKKLKLVENRFAELGELLIQPDIISDQKKYIQLSKEYKDTKKIIDKGEVYKNLIANKSEAQEIISKEKDDEMIEMAKMQLEEVEMDLPKTEEELKVLLIPKIRMIPKMLSLKLGLELVEMRLVFLPVICIECTPNFQNLEIGL